MYLDISLINAAPTGYETLTPDDAAKVLEELLEAQNQTYILGLTLGLPHAEVEAIHKTHTNTRDRLLHILIAFLNRVEPTPTWRVIIDALRSLAVNLPALAKRVEAAHFPDPTSTCDAVPETTTGIAFHSKLPQNMHTIIFTNILFTLQSLSLEIKSRIHSHLNQLYSPV